MPLGLDVVEPPMLFELQKLGIEVRDGQQTMLQAREVKNIDELTLLNMAAAMVDGVYQDIAEALKPGVKESEIVALATARLYEMGSRLRRGDQRDLRRALQPASAQLHRPADPSRRPGVLRHHPVVHGLSHLLLPHVQRRPGDVAAAHRLPQGARMDGQRDRPAEARRVDRTRSRASLPKAQEIGFASEMDAFGLNFCHGLGLGPARAAADLAAQLAQGADRAQGRHGVRGRDLLSGERRHLGGAHRGGSDPDADGPKIISLYPAEELPIANPY